ncbi:type II toxin-antitoxin system RelE/ParE family toxin [uncultured Draconibacterium sp.]|uniref:type II toxin-antitoxin system RelE/ParE family toxin n=1 Tax=uncultured Draconibacterium sp. TaxID=1573823 RepID=UPI0032175BBF
MEEKFNIDFLSEAIDFMNSVEIKARKKIYYNLKKSRVVNDPELFKKLNENIWEFRTLFDKKHYRLFAFWDKTDNKETLVLATHGIIKKTKKTPKSEIKKAEEIRKIYFEQKNKENEK